jgi:4,5-dihydroxyphthalate decarboxylase
MPLKDGRVGSPRLCLEHVEVTPANRAFAPMVNDLAYDVSELALVTLILALEHGRPIVGVPVVLMQQTAYSALVCKVDSNLKRPKDLEGKTIGVRAYTQTTGVWLRGMLQDQFGVDLDAIDWVTMEPSHVNTFEDPPNVRSAPPGATLHDLLRRCEVHALVGIEPDKGAGLRTVLAAPDVAEEEYTQTRKIRPINHTLVVKKTLDQAHPWLRSELARMVGSAKAITSAAAPVDGLEQNRGALETLARYACEQGITLRVLAPEQLVPSEGADER